MCQNDSLASEEPELEFVCGALGEIGQRGMPVEADSVWGAFIAASVAAICGALSRGAQPPGQRESDFVSSEEGRSKR